jgi:hypothetical protein
MQGDGNGTYGHVVELVLVCTPHRVCQIVALSDDAYSLVRVFREGVLAKEDVSFYEVVAPELDVYVLALVVAREELLRDGNWLAVEVFTEGDAGEMEKRGDDVGVT